MSTPGPANVISLPDGKLYRVTIVNTEHYPPGFPAQLVFMEDKPTKSWTASFSVPSVLLTELNIAVTANDGLCQFEFTLHNPTEDQQKAGYIKGTYTFIFVPPGTDPIEFGGNVFDPWKKPGDAEDNWTAEGTPPEG